MPEIEEIDDEEAQQIEQAEIDRKAQVSYPIINWAFTITSDYIFRINEFFLRLWIGREKK